MGHQELYAKLLDDNDSDSIIVRNDLANVDPQAFGGTSEPLDLSDLDVKADGFDLDESLSSMTEHIGRISPGGKGRWRCGNCRAANTLVYENDEIIAKIDR